MTSGLVGCIAWYTITPVTIRHPVSAIVTRPRTSSKHSRMLDTNHDASDVLCQQWHHSRASEKNAIQCRISNVADVACKLWSTFVWLSGMFPAFCCNYYWFTTGRSSPARVAAFPGLPSATGRIPFGRPVSSSRTLATGLWTNGSEPTALCWDDAGWWLPAPGNSSGWRRRIYTSHIVDVVRLVYIHVCDSYLLLSDPRTWPGV